MWIRFHKSGKSPHYHLFPYVLFYIYYFIIYEGQYILWGTMIKCIYMHTGWSEASYFRVTYFNKMKPWKVNCPALQLFLRLRKYTPPSMLLLLLCKTACGPHTSKKYWASLPVGLGFIFNGKKSHNTPEQNTAS